MLLIERSGVTVSVLEYGSLESMVDSLPSSDDRGLVPTELPDLPGLALAEYTLLESMEWYGWNKPEMYMVGVAYDATGTLFKLPLGIDALDPDHEVDPPKVDVGKPFTFMGDGLPLVLPPVKGFLAVRLLIVDSDSNARDTAEAIKAVGEAVGSEQAIALAAATGMPQAAAAAFVLDRH